ncbi:MAG: hypothetical protein ACYCV7_00385 [Acidimicrobiales bacterium]
MAYRVAQVCGRLKDEIRLFFDSSKGPKPGKETSIKGYEWCGAALDKFRARRERLRSNGSPDHTMAQP